MVLVYGVCEDELAVNDYVDASLDTDPNDSKSQTGNVFLVNGDAMSCMSGKQAAVMYMLFKEAKLLYAYSVIVSLTFDTIEHSQKKWKP